MRITCLVENTASDAHLGAEHGLSLYIETAQHRILFDMGQTALFTENAQKLGIDLSLVDLAVLSHGHYDHGGGLPTFLRLNCHAPVYIHRNAFEPHYNGTEKYIGLDPALQSEGRLILTDDVHLLADGLTLYACNERPKIVEMGSFGLNVQRGNKFYPDDFRHEQYLEICENGKNVLISGCSHKGILNIAAWFRPDILVGGFHFSKLPLDGTLKSYAAQLAQYPTRFYTCHCTGAEQFAFMRNEMTRLSYLACGDRIDI